MKCSKCNKEVSDIDMFDHYSVCACTREGWLGWLHTYVVTGDKYALEMANMTQGR